MQGLLYEDGMDGRRPKNNSWHDSVVPADDDFASMQHDFVDPYHDGGRRGGRGPSATKDSSNSSTYSDLASSNQVRQRQGRDRPALNKVDGNRPPWSDDFVSAPADEASRVAVDVSDKFESRRKSGAAAAPRRETRPAWNNDFVEEASVPANVPARSFSPRRSIPFRTFGNYHPPPPPSPHFNVL